MRLDVLQEFAGATQADVAGAYADPGLYNALEKLPFVGTPELVGHNCGAGDTVEIAVRYKVDIDLPAPAKVFVDPDLLTFVEYATYDRSGDGTFRIAPDHYPKLLRFSGTYEMVRARGGEPTGRRTVGDLRVDLGWKGKLFEADVTRVIAEGLERALLAQAQGVCDYLEL